MADLRKLALPDYMTVEEIDSKVLGPTHASNQESPARRPGNRSRNLMRWMRRVLHRPRVFSAAALQRMRLRSADRPKIEADNPATPTTMAAMFLESHVLERKEWVKERKKLSTLLTDSAVNAALNLRTIMDLQMELQRIRNNLDLRSGMSAAGRNTAVIASTDSSAPEIVAEALRIRHNQTPAPMFRLASGVQPVLDAIANGLFDSPGGRVRYAVVQADVIAAVAAGGGVTTKNVHQALGKLYGKLSKQHHGGVSQQIQIREADQTMAEAVAAMSILLFARSLIGCRLDAVFTTAEGKSTVVSLILQSCNIYSFIP